MARSSRRKSNWEIVIALSRPTAKSSATASRLIAAGPAPARTAARTAAAVGSSSTGGAMRPHSAGCRCHHHGQEPPGAKHRADLGRGSRPRFTGNRGTRKPAGRYAAGRRRGPRRGPRRSAIRVSPHSDGPTTLRRITRPGEPAEKLIAVISLGVSGSSIRCSTFRARLGIRRRRWRCERGRSGWRFRCRSPPSSSPCRRPDRFSAARSRG